MSCSPINIWVQKYDMYMIFYNNPLTTFKFWTIVTVLCLEQFSFLQCISPLSVLHGVFYNLWSSSNITFSSIVSIISPTVVEVSS